MEKDIEILKNLVAEYDAQREESKTTNTVIVIDNKDIKAIENLINRVKDLEKEEKELEHLLTSQLGFNLYRDYIPKSKIKAKIEELKGFINDCIISEKGKFCESCKDRCFFNEEIEDLQDLLN